MENTSTSPEKTHSPSSRKSATFGYFLSDNNIEDIAHPFISEASLGKEASLLDKILIGTNAASSMHSDVKIRLYKHQHYLKPAIDIDFSSQSESSLSEAVGNYLFITQEFLPDFALAYGSHIVENALSEYGKALVWTINDGESARLVKDLPKE